LPERDEPTADSIIEVDQAISVEQLRRRHHRLWRQGDRLRDRGQILTVNAQQDFDLEKYTLGVAREIFDRWGRGAIGGDLHACRA
jgi:hypothetical protein